MTERAIADVGDAAGNRDTGKFATFSERPIANADKAAGYFEASQFRAGIESIVFCIDRWPCVCDCVP